MPDPVMKLAPKPDSSSSPKLSFLQRNRSRLRTLLLVVIPALALAIGLGLYLAGGRYISTDNAYVGTEKVLITPDISGKVSCVLVQEGQHVRVGDPFVRDRRRAVPAWAASGPEQTESVRTDFANLKTNYASLHHLVELGEQAVDLRRRDVERKTALMATRSGTQVELDNAQAALLTAELQLQVGRQQLGNTLNQLLGNPILRSRSSRPTSRPKPQSTRRSGTSTIPSSRRRYRGLRPRWTASSWDGS